MNDSSSLVDKLPFTLGKENFIVSCFRHGKPLLMGGYLYAMLTFTYVFYLHFKGVDTLYWEGLLRFGFLSIILVVYICSSFYEHMFSVHVAKDKLTIRRNLYCFGTACEVKTKHIQKIQIKKRPKLIIVSLLFGIQFVEIIASDPETSEDRVLRFPVVLLRTGEVDGLGGVWDFEELLLSITKDVDCSEYVISDLYAQHSWTRSG